MLNEIQQSKDLDERILKNAVAHAAVSIHLLEDQLHLSPARIEGFRNQAAKYEINISFLEPSDFLKQSSGGPGMEKISSMTKRAPLHKVL